MDKSFWDNKYQEKQTGWDIGYISTPIKEYIDQLKDKNIKILIPGCGFAHEARYLHEVGFNNVYIMDMSSLPLENFRNSLPSFPIYKIINEDFFKHNGEYDLIIEQTLFCAIMPNRREEYVNKIYNLLSEKGKYVGVLFNCQFEEGPPFGGSQLEYIKLFSKNFSKIKIEECYNSIEPRKEKEVFIIAKK